MSELNKAIAPDSKRHFELLDGLRGIAAIAVVLFHFMEIVAPDYRDSFIPHSYLAVDFFFCLSGFVVAYAYDEKLIGLGKFEFFKRRFIRLQPLVIIGSVIGLFAFIFDPFSNLISSFSNSQVLLLFLSGCLLIPYPIVPQRYFNLFHLNPPTWSLFWEYIANIVYAFFLAKASKTLLWIIVVISAGLLCYESFQSGYLAVGFGGDNFWAGGIRLSFSFTAGILLFRSNWLIHRKIPFWILMLALSLVFFIPYSEVITPVIDPVLVIFYFPILIAICAGQIQQPPIVRNLCKWLGDLSYPLYMVHYPFIWIFMSYVEQHQPSKIQMAIIVTLGSIFLIFFAYFVFKMLDKPFRQELQNRWIKKTNKTT